MSHLDDPPAWNHPTDRAYRWSMKLSYDNKEKIRNFIFRLYAVSEEMKIEKNKEKNKKGGK